MKAKAYLTHYDVITSFGQGLQKNMDAILANQSAAQSPQFPLELLGFEQNQFSSKNYFIIHILLNSLMPSLENKHLDAIIILNSHFTLKDIIQKFESTFIKSLEDFHSHFYMKGILSNYLKKMNVSFSEENIYQINNTCTTGVSILNFAEQGIHLGKWQRVLVLALDPSDIYGSLSLSALGALSPSNTSRPFHKERDGFVKADGAAAALIVSENELPSTEAFSPVLGLRKHCQTSDAYRLTDGRDDALGAIRAMQEALTRSNVNPEEMAFVKTHGTGTFLNDIHEAKAIETVFKSAPRIPVTSLKGHLGHTTDASGLVETLIAGYAFHNDTILPIRDLESTDFSLNFVKSAMKVTNRKYFLSSNLGFGGNNSSLVVERISL